MTIPVSASIQQEGTASRKKVFFTQAYNPHNEWYEDDLLSVLEEDPSPPNDNKITKPYLQRA